jgi:hypothetical protein
MLRGVMGSVVDMTAARRRSVPPDARTARLVEVIDAARDILGTYTAVATAIGIKDSALAQWKSGAVRDLKLDHFFALCRIADYNPEWVVSGVGPKAPYGLSSALAEIGGIVAAMDDPAARSALLRELTVFASFRARP